MVLAALTLALPGGATEASADHGRWRRPLPGGMLERAYTYDPSTPFARGRRRGIDLRGRPGAPVLAACAGTVAPAGAVPRLGRGVTLRCGPLVATELGLAALAVRRDERVHAGQVVGRLGPRGVLRLGARRAGARLAYVDPAPLLEGPERTPPPGAPGAPPAPVVPRRSPVPPAPRLTPATGPGRAPWPAVAGAALLAAGAIGGGTVRARRRRARPGSRTATVQR
jgi:hypothetical protein